MRPEAAPSRPLAFRYRAGSIRLNHARLASTDLGRQAHFGGFFISGAGA